MLGAECEVEDDAGVADTTSNRLERAGPVTAVSRPPQQEAGEICGLVISGQLASSAPLIRML